MLLGCFGGAPRVLRGCCGVLVGCCGVLFGAAGCSSGASGCSSGAARVLRGAARASRCGGMLIEVLRCFRCEVLRVRSALGAGCFGCQVRRVQHLAAPRSTPEHPGAPRGTSQHPGAPRSTRQHPGAPRSTRQHPGAPLQHLSSSVVPAACSLTAAGRARRRVRRGRRCAGGRRSRRIVGRCAWS